MALSQFLENNQQQVSMMDKAVLEIGAGTGLLSTVAGLLGESKCSLHSASNIKHSPVHLDTEIITGHIRLKLIIY